jgi:hypothetical protein
VARAGDVTASRAGAPRLVLALFLVLAAAVAVAYSRIEPPLGIVLSALLCGWLALFTLAALGPGSAVWRVVAGGRLDRPTAWPIAIAAGAAILAAVAGALGACGLLGPIALWSVLLGSAAWGALVLVRERPRPSLGLGWGVLGAAGLLGAVTLLAAATPSPFYDQVHYHLAFPERWLREGRIVVYPRQSYSYLAANMGLLYTYALAGPGVWAAQTLHWWMGGLTAWGVHAMSREIGADDRGAAWASALVLATPAFLLTSTWAA